MLDLIQNVVTGIAAAVVTMLVGYYLVGGREPEPMEDSEGSAPTLGYFAQRSPAHAVIASLGLVLAASLGAAFLAGSLVGLGTKGLGGIAAALSFANDHAWNQLPWAFWNYLVWGALSWFLVAFARHTLTPDIRVFATAGLLGGFHHIMANLGIHYIGRLVLGNTTVAELYALEPAALTRMWLPYFLESISAGVLLAYYLTIASNRPIAQGLYRLRYKILMVILVVLGLNYPAVLAVEEGSFVRTALGYQNTGIVWWGCLGAGVAGLLLGTAVYDLGVKRLLSIRRGASLGSRARWESASQGGVAGERLAGQTTAPARQRTVGLVGAPWDSLARGLRDRSEELQGVARDVPEVEEDRRGEQRARETPSTQEEAGPCENGNLRGLAFLAASVGALVGSIVALLVSGKREGTL